ncbi:MAG: hypothetical protein U0176_13180 [Bacteroidia bacterium]
MKTQRFIQWQLLLAAFVCFGIGNQLSAQSAICEGEQVVLTLSGYTGTIQWQSSIGPTGPFSNLLGVTGDSASIAPSLTLYYRAEVTTGTCNPFYSDTIMISVNPNPVADAGADMDYCAGAPGFTIGGSPAASGGTAPYFYLWNPSTDLSSDTVANPTATPATSRSYTLMVTDSNGCTAWDSMLVLVHTPPVADAGTFTSITCSDSTQLNASATGGTAPYSFAWSPSMGLSNPNIANPWASGNSTTLYTVTVTDNIGCSATDTVTVAVAGGGHGTLTFNYTTSVIDTSFVVPCADSIVIEVWGAEGGNNTNSTVAPGMGAYQKGTFVIASGSRLKILVGEKPSFGGGNGGGGGSFVTLTNNTPLIIAGGGGGSSQTTDSPNKHGQSGQNGGQGAAGGGAGGTGGNGGSIGPSGFQSGAGGGLLTNGTNGWTTNTGGIAFISGGSGGTANSNARGGFGGGGSGSSYVVGGGGGGYSGGGSGGNSTAGVGGGGGSYNSGTNAVSTSGVRSGHGQVIITW